MQFLVNSDTTELKDVLLSAVSSTPHNEQHPQGRDKVVDPVVNDAEVQKALKEAEGAPVEGAGAPGGGTDLKAFRPPTKHQDSSHILESVPGGAADPSTILAKASHHHKTNDSPYPDSTTLSFGKETSPADEKQGPPPQEVAKDAPRAVVAESLAIATTTNSVPFDSKATTSTTPLPLATHPTEPVRELPAEPESANEQKKVTLPPTASLEEPTTDFPEVVTPNEANNLPGGFPLGPTGSAPVPAPVSKSADTAVTNAKDSSAFKDVDITEDSVPAGSPTPHNSLAPSNAGSVSSQTKGAHHHKAVPSFGERLAGEFNMLIGKVTHNPEKVEHGQAQKEGLAEDEA